MSATYSVVAVARTPQAAAAPTLSELGPLVGSFSWVETTRGAGSASVSVNADSLDDTIKARLRELGTNPVEVWVYRDSTKVFAGPVVSVGVQGPIVTLTCGDLLTYLAYMLVPTNKSWSATEQTTIVKTLIDDWQALSYGDFGLDTSSMASTGTTRTHDIAGATEFPSVLEETLRLSQADNGFDIYIDPDTREVVIASPLRGSDLSTGVFLERGIGSSNLLISVAPGIAASEVYGVGTGPDLDPPLASTGSDTDFREAFGRTGLATRYDPVVNQAMLDDLVARDAGLVAAQFFVPAPNSLFQVSDGRYEDFGAGDIVTYSHDSGLGTHTGAYRVASRQMAVGADGTETMSVEFE